MLLGLMRVFMPTCTERCRPVVLLEVVCAIRIIGAACLEGAYKTGDGYAECGPAEHGGDGHHVDDVGGDGPGGLCETDGTVSVSVEHHGFPVPAASDHSALLCHEEYS